MCVCIMVKFHFFSSLTAAYIFSVVFLNVFFCNTPKFIVKQNLKNTYNKLT